MTRVLSLFFIFSMAIGWSSDSFGKSKQYLLTYDQLLRLNSEERASYLKGLQKVMLTFGEDSPAYRSFWQFMFTSEAHADADVQFRCVGGGVPIRLQSEFTDNPRGQRCRTNTYAGLTCSSGYICNPYVFGVNRDGTPVCMASATTQNCFNRVVTGTNSFFPDDLFNSEEGREGYTEFLNDFDALCNGSGNLAGGQRAMENQACELARRQLRVNLNRVNRNVLSNPLLNEELMTRTGELSNHTGDEISSGSGNPNRITLGSPADIYPNIGEYLDSENDSLEYEEFLRLYRMFGGNPALQNSQRALVRALAFYANNRNGGLNNCSGGDDRASENLGNQEWIVISDLTLPSNRRRIFFLNTRTGEVISDYSSHGSGSNGRGNCTQELLREYNLTSCNQIPTVMGEDVSRELLESGRSHTTRGGFFETGDLIHVPGKPRWSGSPNSMRLIGLEASNADAWDNSVIMHGAAYVSDGHAGRSWGCPTMQRDTFETMRSRIDDGALMYIHTINEDQEGLPEC